MIGAAVFLSLVSLALFLSVNSLDRITKFNQSIANRIELNKVGTELVVKKVILGYGAGNVDVKLKKEYERLGIREAFSQNYNIHNQYLQSLLATGLGGFGLLMALIVFTLKFAKNRMFAFLLLSQFLIFFMIESVLVRQKGIVAFITWLLFISLYLHKEKLSLSHNED